MQGLAQPAPDGVPALARRGRNDLELRGGDGASDGGAFGVHASVRAALHESWTKRLSRILWRHSRILVTRFGEPATIWCGYGARR